MVAVTTEVLALTDDQLRDKLIDEGNRRGNAIVSVDEADGVGGYCFTAGAWRLHGVAEAVVIGLPVQMAPVLLDAYVDRAACGEQFTTGVLYQDFFDGLPVTFEHVAPEYYPEFFGSAFLLYPDGDFPAVQIIVPTPDGHWPWSPNPPEGFARWAPVLTASGYPESWTPGVNGP